MEEETIFDSGKEDKFLHSKDGILPITVNLRIKFVGEKDVDFPSEIPENLESQVITAEETLPWSGISLKDLSILRKFEPEFLLWLGKSKKNKIFFAVNPIKALEKAGLELPRKLLKDILQIREINLAIRPWFPNIRINKIIINSNEPDEKFSPNPHLPLFNKEEKTPIKEE